MKGRRIVWIVCIALVLALACAFFVRAILLNREPEAPMEEEELVDYLSKLKGPDDTDEPRDFSWDQ